MRHGVLHITVYSITTYVASSHILQDQPHTSILNHPRFRLIMATVAELSFSSSLLDRVISFNFIIIIIITTDITLIGHVTGCPSYKNP